MEERNQKIIEFANKWIPKFADSNVSCYDLVDTDFADDCFELKFEMDCGESLNNRFSITLEEALTVLDQIDDIDFLGAAIFSYWRYFNHWAWDASEIDEHRDWFITTLEKLKELASK